MLVQGGVPLLSRLPQVSAEILLCQVSKSLSSRSKSVPILRLAHRLGGSDYLRSFLNHIQVRFLMIARQPLPAIPASRLYSELYDAIRA